MLTGKQIAVIGGDARQIEIIERLGMEDADVYLTGFDQLNRQFLGAMNKKLEDIPPKHLDAILLPVSGMQDNGEVESVFSSEKIVLLENWLKQTPSTCPIYTGIVSQALEEMAKRTGKKLVRLLERDDVAILNSIPTAEGTLLIAIEETDMTVHGSHTLVLGFGRIGLTIARTFQAMGAYVEVGSDEPAERARAESMNVESFPLDQLSKKVQHADLCINTIPTQILTADVLTHMSNRCFIIDLASKPGGTDFQYADKRGIRTKHALGLPGLVAPKTAGQILADVIVRLLEDE